MTIEEREYTADDRSGAIFGMLALCVVLSACQATPQASPIRGDIRPPQTTNIIATCHATKAKFVLGQVVTAPLLDEARDRSGARAALTRLPNDTTELAFNGARLILDVDDNGRALVASCG